VVVISIILVSKFLDGDRYWESMQLLLDKLFTKTENNNSVNHFGLMNQCNLKVHSKSKSISNVFVKQQKRTHKCTIFQHAWFSIAHVFACLQIKMVLAAWQATYAPPPLATGRWQNHSFLKHF
jgi:hypothetical protein